MLIMYHLNRSELRSIMQSLSSHEFLVSLHITVVQILL